MMAAESTTPGISLATLLEGLSAERFLQDVVVQGLATDSREVRPGDLFLARQGLQVHGLLHVQQALERGAAAVVWEPVDDIRVLRIADALPVPAVAVAGLGQRLGIIADRFYAHPSHALHMIGVTGTDGKTSVTHFIAQALSGEGESCGLLGTLGYGLYGDLCPPSHTTPDAVRLQQELATLRGRGASCVAMEVSSHALHQQRTAGVMFDTAVLTHLSRDHLDYHGSVEAYAEAKRRLFLSPDLRCAVLNLEDEFGRQLARELEPQLRVIGYRAAPGGALHDYPDWLELNSVQSLPGGIALDIASSWGAAQLQAPLLGTFNAQNLLAALGALLACGMSLEVAVQRLSRVQTVPGRMELCSVPGKPRVVIDYAHTPHALETVLQALRPHCSGRLVCVFGAGGNRDKGKRPQMGFVAERNADRVYLTSDNPRNEDPALILDQIAAGFDAPARALRIEDRAAAIAAAIRDADPDDLVLVAGKGHESFQQIGARKLPFSDRDQVWQVLREPGE